MLHKRSAYFGKKFVQYFFQKSLDKFTEVWYNGNFARAVPSRATNYITFYPFCQYLFEKNIAQKSFLIFVQYY